MRPFNCRGAASRRAALFERPRFRYGFGIRPDGGQ
jgi:hypothetical protein